MVYEPWCPTKVFILDYPRQATQLLSNLLWHGAMRMVKDRVHG